MQKTNSKFRSLSLFIFSFIAIQLSAQTGLNFQGVARANNNVIIASQPITLKLSILQGSETGSIEYVETRRVITNAQGLFNIVIGDTGAINTIGDFANISWKKTPKYLKIEMDPTAGNNFVTMGTTQFQYVAYAEFAKSVDAENIVGIIPVNLGGTGVNSLNNLKTSLTIDKINNTSDLSKPISTLTQAALDLKLNVVDTTKFIKQAYLDSALLTKLNNTAIVSTATNAINATTAISATSAISATTAVSAGTASTATKLATARNINGVAFDGSADITIATIIDAGTLTGTTLHSTITGSSLTSVGTLSAGAIPYSLLTGTVPTWNQNTNGNAATATLAANSTNAITATSAITAGNITATTNSSLTTLPNLSSIGSITTGVWSGTVISVEKGGTGLTSSGSNGQVLTATGSGTLTWTTPANGSGGGGTVHTIGEAYGGGIVFYVYDGGTHGLIAATTDQSVLNVGIRWYGGTFTNTRARASGIGAGLKNTAIIIANQSAIDGEPFAATICNEYTVTENVNGISIKYGDWYLPSVHELYLLYLQKEIFGNMVNYYWSSTESDGNSLWYVNFNNGYLGATWKSNACNVRAIRAF